MNDDLSPRENWIRAVTFGYPHHIPYESVIRNVEFEGDMMWMGERGLDHWGVRWEYELEEYLPMVQDHPIKNPDDLDRYRPPEPAFRLKPSTLELLKDIQRDQFVLMGFHPTILFERAWFLMGMDNLMLSMIDYPDRVRRLLGRIMDYQVAIATR